MVLTEKEILQTLQDFYKDWMDWVKDGAPKIIGGPFHRADGLCTAIGQWAYVNKLSHELCKKAKEYMKLDFKQMGLDTCYPFGYQQWDIEWSGETMHRNPNRINFVKTMLQRRI